MFGKKKQEQQQPTDQQMHDAATAMDIGNLKIRVSKLESNIPRPGERTLMDCLAEELNKQGSRICLVEKALGNTASVATTNALGARIEKLEESSKGHNLDYTNTNLHMDRVDKEVAGITSKVGHCEEMYKVAQFHWSRVGSDAKEAKDLASRVFNQAHRTGERLAKDYVPIGRFEELVADFDELQDVVREQREVIAKLCDRLGILIVDRNPDEKVDLVDIEDVEECHDCGGVKPKGKCK